MLDIAKVRSPSDRHLLRSRLVRSVLPSLLCERQKDAFRSNTRRVVLILTMAIYTLTGRDIYQKRQSLREFSALSHIEEGENSAPNSRTTDVQITSQATLKYPQSLHHAHGMRNFRFSNLSPDSQDYQPYTINIESPKPSRRSPSSGSYNTDIAAWAYTKVAILFFAALLITWVSPPLCLPSFPSICAHKNSKPRAPTRSPRPSTACTRSYTPGISTSRSCTLKRLCCRYKGSGTRSSTSPRQCLRVGGYGRQ